MKRLFIAIIACFSCLVIFAQNIELRITNLNNKKGHIQIMVFKDAESYKTDDPISITRFAKTSMKDGDMKVSMKIPTGIIGVILLDDENDTEEMEYNLLGFPKEGFGFAGYYHKGIRRPDFDNFKFEVGVEKVRMDIRVRYY